ncbi:hypothetical protein [Microbulbifer sp. TYP-18]|uniref:hypothetical protein n=1 Tax=Microbulbifer sp. TYP-18 TaxID=3230024 RepID=UPI0034C655E0
MATELYAAIREDSRYFNQNPSRQLLPFPVSIADTTDTYRVRGNGDSYRLEDVHLFVKAGPGYHLINH